MLLLELTTKEKFTQKRIRNSLLPDLFWEQKYLTFLEESPWVESYSCESIRVPYTGLLGEKRYTLPDFLVNFVCGNKEIVEIRPEWRLRDKLTRLKMAAVDAYCFERGWNSVWVYNIEDDLFFEREFPFLKEVTI